MSLALAIGFGALGAFLASFLMLVVERVYTGQSWRSGHSRCNSCNTVLTAQDLIPVLSWLASLGRCRRCGARLPATYIFVEVLLGGLFALAYLTFGLDLTLFVFLFTLCTLTFIVLYDLRHMIVPLPGSLLLLGGSLGMALLRPGGSSEFGFSLLVAGGIALFIFLLHALSRGRAMGLGDAPVAFSLALLVGPALAVSGLLFSFWIGALFGIGVLLLRRGGPTMGIEIPFVPFLAAGFLLAFFTQWIPFPFLS